MRWQKVEIGKVSKVISGFAFKSKDFQPIGTPVIKIKNIKDENIVLDESDCVDSAIEVPLRFHLSKGDILISLTGSHITLPSSVVGRVAKYRHETNSYLNQRAGKFINIDNEKCVNDYLFYFLLQKETLTKIANKAQGAANQANISPGDVEGVEINLPPLPTQRKIASILSAYDDLIENNLKRIKLLEEATRNSYKQFKKETITEWIAGPFSDFFKINNGCAFKAEWYADSGVPIIRTRDYSYSKFLNVGQPIFIDDFQAENFSKFLLKEYDFMLIMVGASIGRYGIILPKDLPALQNQNQWALRENSEYYYLKVIKLLLIEEILETLLQQRTGAARDFFRASFLNELEVQVPPEKSGKELNSTLENYFNQINILQKQNTKLREARDILLPKLMNGQIEV